MEMYLKRTKQKSGRVYLSIMEGYYDPIKKYSRSNTIEKIGYLDDLEKEYPDPIAHFTEVANKMNEKKSEDRQYKTIIINGTERVEGNQRKNFGYAALSAVYHELEIDRFFANRQQSLGSKYSINAIIRLLVFSRILSPGSKKKAYDEKEQFFERSDFTITDMYRCLSRFALFKEDLQLWIHERITANYERDTSITYYDVTNYYFEIDEQDNLRKKGVSKEHRPDPIVQMGLLMDNNGLPMAYELFPGNQNDCVTLLPVIKRIRKQFNIGKLIVVSDKGLNTQKNAYYLANRRGGYVFSQSVRGGNKELKDYVLVQDGYEWIGGNFKKKSRQFTRKVEFEDDGGITVNAEIAEKQVVFYSREYDLKAKAERENVIRKARGIIANPKNFNKKNSYGAAKYIRQIEYDKKTGEIIVANSMLAFNDEILAEEEKYDGYYVIVTNAYNKSDDWVIDTYKGLWRIEETFKVTKSDLEARPAFASREDRIQAHFLICFVSLVIIRLLQRKLNDELSSTKIINSLSKACCSLVKDNFYLFDFEDDTLNRIGKLFNIDFSLKFRTQAEIKNILAKVKLI
jgi:transposase